MASSVFKLIDLNKSLEQAQACSHLKKIDWSKCALCQVALKGEVLVDPSKNKRVAVNDAYTCLGRNLVEFHKLRCIPDTVNLELLKGEHVTVEESLRENNAVYHKACALKFNNTKLARAKAKKRSIEEENVPPPSPAKTRKSLSMVPYEKDTCLYCGLGSSRIWPLSTVTEEGEKSIKTCAANLRDSKMLTLCCGPKGLVGMSYHSRCRTNYLNRVRPKAASVEKDSQAHGVVLAQLVGHLHEVRTDCDQPPVFKMSQLTRLYGAEMEALGASGDVHSTRLRERLLQECPDVESTGRVGQDILIAFKRDIDWTIRDDCRRDYDVEGLHLSRAAEIVRKDIFTNTNFDHSGSREIPLSLKTLVKMIIQGPALKSQDNNDDQDYDQIVTSMAELLVFHAAKRVKGKSRRHNRDQETATPVYVASKIYGETRKKGLIDLTYKLGLSISYDRLQTILDETAAAASQLYQHEGIVCPVELRRGVFTTGATDNFDHNTSSTTSKQSLHGTVVTIMQHPSPATPGQERVQGKLSCSEKLSKFELPAEYANVKISFLDPKRSKCPITTVSNPPEESTVNPREMENQWLQCSASEATCTTWPEFHSDSDARKPEDKEYRTRVTILPVFYEVAHTMSMMQHSMTIVAQTVHFLNPGQIPVMTVDQPLYALCKCIQWQVQSLGEKHFFVMFGGMHIELAALRVVGQWLEGSGWTNALVEGGITTSGRADSIIKVSHLTRSRYAHQVTAAALYRLQLRAYETGTGDADDPLTFEQWREERRNASAQFRFWDIALELELTMLLLVRSIRTGDFELYIAALQKLVPWFFALNRTHYARWIPVHIRDLANVHTTHPDLYEEFKAGRFVARLSARKFSGIALDQAHEQQNARLKGDGGVIGLTENPLSLRKWMLATPELAKLNKTFEDKLSRGDISDNHHQATRAARELFSRNVTSLETTLNAMGNPFMDQTTDLFNIDTQRVCSPEVVKFVTEVEELGGSQYRAFCAERLETGTVPLQDPIRENKIKLFSTSQRQDPTKAKAQLKSLKENCSLWSRLYVATSSNRPAELDTFFSHENSEYPPSLSLNGDLRSTDKSDLVKCLIDLTKIETGDRCPEVDAKVLDGAAVIHMLKPGISVNFEQYIDNVFVPFLKTECRAVQRVDVVWDRYFKDSLKGMTRKKRGTGVRTRVSLLTKIPTNWMDFLRHDENKTELFHLLAKSIEALCIQGVQLCSTIDGDVVQSPPADARGLAPCNHEEADTRIFVHVADACQQGHNRLLIRATDTDIVVIAISCVHRLPAIKELWVHIKAGRKNTFLPVHEIAASLGPAKALAVVGLHAFTGNDNISSFYNMGKTKAVAAMQRYEESVQGFIDLCNGNLEDARQHLINFVIAMYSRSEMYPSLSACRRALFSKFDQPIDKIPPTEDALDQHMRRAAYQAGVWFQAMNPMQTLPSPGDWGWSKNSNGLWEPVWRTLQVAAEACAALVRCKCKKECRGNCSCKKDPRSLNCTDLCRCPCDRD